MITAEQLHPWLKGLRPMRVYPAPFGPEFVDAWGWTCVPPSWDGMFLPDDVERHALYPCEAWDMPYESASEAADAAREHWQEHHVARATDAA